MVCDASLAVWFRSRQNEQLLPLKVKIEEPRAVACPSKLDTGLAGQVHFARCLVGAPENSTWPNYSMFRDCVRIIAQTRAKAMLLAFTGFDPVERNALWMD
jgi:hypothetical protein